jgi:hypothetical protein
MMSITSQMVTICTNTPDFYRERAYGVGLTQHGWILDGLIVAYFQHGINPRVRQQARALGLIVTKHIIKCPQLRPGYAEQFYVRCTCRTAWGYDTNKCKKNLLDLSQATWCLGVLLEYRSQYWWESRQRIERLLTVEIDPTIYTIDQLVSDLSSDIPPLAWYSLHSDKEHVALHLNGLPCIWYSTPTWIILAQLADIKYIPLHLNTRRYEAIELREYLDPTRLPWREEFHWNSDSVFRLNTFALLTAINASQQNFDPTADNYMSWDDLRHIIAMMNSTEV